MTDLLPCPFCGWKTPSIHSTGSGTAWVTCDRCLSQTGGFQDADMPEHILRDHAAKEWNRRSSPAREQVTEAMVERAIASANEVLKTVAPIAIKGEHLEFPPADTKRIFRAALEAALSPSPTGGEARAVAVKPLRWRDHGPNAFPARFWGAETPFGRYEIEEECASDSPRYRVEWHSRLIIDGDSLPEAQEAAQADYERRILSALTHPAPLMDEVEAVLEPFVREFEDRRDAYIRRYPRNPAVGAHIFDKMRNDWKMENSTFTMGVFRAARDLLTKLQEGGR